MENRRVALPAVVVGIKIVVASGVELKTVVASSVVESEEVI